MYNFPAYLRSEGVSALLYKHLCLSAEAGPMVPLAPGALLPMLLL